MHKIRFYQSSLNDLINSFKKRTINNVNINKRFNTTNNSLNPSPTAVVMLNMGGPTTVNEVEFFLTNLFLDKEIIPLGKFQKLLGTYIAKRRTPSIQEQYSKIGGGSPIKKWTNIQGKELCKILDQIRPQSAPHKHYIMFRYANPLTEETLLSMKKDGVKRAIAFLQYPQWSCTTSGSSLNNLWRKVRELELGSHFEWSIIDRWNLFPGYINAVAKRIKDGLEQFDVEDRQKVIIMFSAHSVPMKVVRKGDSYTKEIASTSERVMEALNIKNSHILAWQSKVGFLPWMGPSTSDVIKGLAQQGHKHVLAVPIAFTSDHVETLYEIDIEYAKEAEEAGIKQFKRSPSLNDEPLIIQAMADLVKEHLDSGKNHYSDNYKLNCPQCTNPTCRIIINPSNKKDEYVRLRDFATSTKTPKCTSDFY